MDNRITALFGIKYPVIQAGMIWVSGWKLASAVSNAGGLGLLGSGSMYPDILEEHIRKCRLATDQPFGVNVPLIYPDVDQLFNIIIREKIKIVFTSAGNPAKWTPMLKDHGITVVHVIANVRSAQKCEEAGVDAVVAEGFEAGGHDGKEETTTLTLIPLIRKATSLPLMAAGGIVSGKAMLAAMILGAEGVQVGTRFAASVESSAHPSFKQRILEARDGDTILTMKQIIPVRILKNKFFDQVRAMEESGAPVEKLRELLGRGRAKKGMFEGNLEEGELEIGQASALVEEIKPAAEILQEIIREFRVAKEEAGTLPDFF
ncbi:MAG TPA: nitronate monooxygenase [Bacteroidales bacterium]|nr:nitronate monooxygenase [Bacteroidales bacterium]